MEKLINLWCINPLLKPQSIHTPVKYKEFLNFLSYTLVFQLRFDINRAHKTV